MHDGYVRCESCQSFVNFQKCRVIGKQAGSFRCPSCHSKQQLLRKSFGSWPIPEFIALNTEAKHEFWQSTSSDRLALTAAVENLLQESTRTEIFAENGEYLPLSVWAVWGVRHQLDR